MGDSIYILAGMGFIGMVVVFISMIVYQNDVQNIDDDYKYPDEWFPRP